MAILSNPRATVEESPDGLLITIRPPKFWPVLIFLAVWLSGWVLGEVTAVRSVLFGAEDMTSIGFLAIWLTGWTIGGAVAWTIFLFMAFGRERILIQSGSVFLRKEVLGIGRTRQFQRSLIRDLKIREADDTTRRRRGPQAEQLSFEYEGKRVNFGIATTEAETEELLQLVRRRLGA